VDVDGVTILIIAAHRRNSVPVLAQPDACG